MEDDYDWLRRGMMIFVITGLILAGVAVSPLVAVLLTMLGALFGLKYQ